MTYQVIELGRVQNDYPTNPPSSNQLNNYKKLKEFLGKEVQCQSRF